MTDRRITPVILCGGVGARLWPRSRASAPKPFLPLIGPGTLFQETFERCRQSGFGEITVVTGASHVELVDTQLEQSRVGEIVVEPEPRGTAAAVALAALRLPEDALMLVCPSDHHISDLAAFRNASLAASELAAEGWLACLVVPPTDAATRFGYVRPGESIGAKGFRVSDFVEKPSAERARRFVSSGDYAWNAGIFAFRAGSFLDELAKFRPELAAAARQSVAQGQKSGSRFLPEPKTFGGIVEESIDRAVMEHSDRGAMVMSEMGWSDIGDWQSVRAARDKDQDGNSIRGPADLAGCRNLLVDSDGPKVHAVGLEDLIIVVDGNDILVSSGSSVSSFSTPVRKPTQG